MKRIVYLFLSLLIGGIMFQSCDDSKTYAEQLEDEEREVKRYIRDNGIRVISQEVFEKNDTVTNLDRNEYVALSDGVYMQIVDRGSENHADTFASNDEICIRYVERNLMRGDSISCLNVFMEGYEDPQIYANPTVFRYVLDGSYAYGTFIQQDYLWSGYQTSVVPTGWLLALPFIRNHAHVRLIVPSKAGHSVAQQNVIPYHYDIRSLSKALN